MKERTRYGILHLVSFCLMIYVADQSILVSGKLHAFLKFLPWVYNYLTGWPLIVNLFLIQIMLQQITLHVISHRGRRSRRMYFQRRCCWVCWCCRGLCVSDGEHLIGLHREACTRLCSREDMGLTTASPAELSDFCIRSDKWEIRVICLFFPYNKRGRASFYIVRETFHFLWTVLFPMPIFLLHSLIF